MLKDVQKDYYLAYTDSGQVKRLMTLKNYFHIKNYNGL